MHGGFGQLKCFMKKEKRSSSDSPPNLRLTKTPNRLTASDLMISEAFFDLSFELGSFFLLSSSCSSSHSPSFPVLRTSSRAPFDLAMSSFVSTSATILGCGVHLTTLLETRMASMIIASSIDVLRSCLELGHSLKTASYSDFASVTAHCSSLFFIACTHLSSPSNTVWCLRSSPLYLHLHRWHPGTSLGATQSHWGLD